MRKEFVYLFLGVLMIGAGVVLLYNSPLTGNQILNIQDETLRANITISNAQFTPQNLTVKEGTIVTFINKDNITYEVVVSNGVTVMSKEIPAMQNYDIWFSKSGNYAISEKTNPKIVATIHVGQYVS